METKERIIKLLSDKLGVAEINIKENDLLVGDLDMDSLDVVEAVMTIEKEFGLTLADSELNDIKTVGDIVKMVEKSVKGSDFQSIGAIYMKNSIP